MRTRRPVVVVTVAVAALFVSATPAYARTDTRSKPIVYVHGWSSSSATDCTMWTSMDNQLRAWGHTGTKMTVKYYSSDSNCTDSLLSYGSHTKHYGSSHTTHNNGTDIRHLAYHLAQMITAKFGSNPVDIVAHSMGGLITRYMVGERARNNADFPSSLTVEDIVTMGTPHNGTGWANFCGGTQCVQMRPGSSFINYLNANAQNPKAGDTDWTLMGSDDDAIVSASSATSMTANHKVIYLGSSNVGHSDFYALTTDSRTADVHYNDYGGTWYAWYDAPWPVRWSDFSLYYGTW